MTAPARAGPTTRLISAFTRSREIPRGTEPDGSSSARKAIRAGLNSANPIACTIPAPSSIQYSITPKATARPIQALDSASSRTETCRTSRLGSRSAATPPHGVATSMATPNASSTPPSAALEPVSSKASHPRAIVWAMTPRKPLIRSMPKAVRGAAGADRAAGRPAVEAAAVEAGRADAGSLPAPGSVSLLMALLVRSRRRSRSATPWPGQDLLRQRGTEPAGGVVHRPGVPTPPLGHRLRHEVHEHPLVHPQRPVEPDGVVEAGGRPLPRALERRRPAGDVGEPRQHAGVQQRVVRQRSRRLRPQPGGPAGVRVGLLREPAAQAEQPRQPPLGQRLGAFRLRRRGHRPVGTGGRPAEG